MKILCYFDMKKNRRREFVRFQISHDKTGYVFEELICKTFGEETACGEIDRQEYSVEQDARREYENRIRKS